MTRHLAHTLVVLSLATAATAAFAQQSALRSVHVNGVTLLYLDQGRGTPLSSFTEARIEAGASACDYPDTIPAISAIQAILAISFIYPVADAPMSEMWR